MLKNSFKQMKRQSWAVITMKMCPLWLVNISQEVVCS